MSQSWFLVGLLVAGIACLPYLLRWVQARKGHEGLLESQAKVVSVLAIGPQQRVVTVKVSSGDKAATLVLGVTAASVSCLHKWESVGPIDPAQQLGSCEIGARHVQ
jgi:flagellar protein FliO/FliZ